MENRLLHTPVGVRDIYGEEFQKKLTIQETLHKQLMSYGYKDIQTPTFEFFDVFSHKIGTIPSRELYKFFDRDNNTLVLRPDFTPSIARAAAKYFMSENLPIRLCYMGNTFSNSSELQGKLKEVTQLGAELLGDDSVIADAEMISLVIECIRKAGILDFQVSIGQVEFFKGICEEAGVDETAEMNLREMISNKNVFGVEEILEDLKIETECKERILKIPDLFGTVEVLKEAELFAKNPRSKNAVSRLRLLYDTLCLYGIENYVTFDLGMLSKYNYYTGVTFRAYTFGTGDAIVKGGRYDSLLSQFGKKCAAIGFVVVVDQLMSALTRQKIEIPIQKDGILVVYKEEFLKEALFFAKEHRDKGEKVELMSYKEEKSLADYEAYSAANQIGRIYYIEESDKIRTISEVQ